MKLWLSIAIIHSCVGSFAQISDSVHLRVFQFSEPVSTPSNNYQKTVFDSAVLANYQGSSLADLLQIKGPVFIKTYGQGGLATSSFRGTGASHTKIFWNGIPINSPSLGQIDLSTVPIYFMDQIELHHGASSLIDGSGGLGGGIQLNNSLKLQDGISTSIYQQGASFGTYKSGLTVGYGHKNWAVRTKLFYQKADNNFPFYNISKSDFPIEIMTNAELKRHGMQQEFKFKINSKQKIYAAFMITDSKRNLPTGIQDEIGNQKQSDKNMRGLINWKLVNAKLKLDLSSGYVADHLIYQNPTASIYSDNKTSTYSQIARAKYLLGDRYYVRGGLSHDYQMADISGYDQLQKRSVASSFVEFYSINNKFSYSFLMRQELYDNIFSPALPSVSFSFDISKAITISQSASRIYHMPTMNDLYWIGGGNPNLSPEKGWTAEQSVNYKIENENARINIALTGFYGKIDDWILWSPNSSGMWEAQNIRGVINSGIEVNTTLQFKINTMLIRWGADYAYTSSVTVKGSTSILGKQLLYVPENQIKTGATIIWKNIDVAYNHMLVDKRFITTDNAWIMPTYNLGNVSVQYRFALTKRHVLHAKAEILNVFDTQYQAIAWRPMPGRNYALTIKYFFR